MSLTMEGLGALYDTNTKSNATTNQLEDTLKSDLSKATEDELMDVCKDFEAYFTEQMFKAMRNTVPKEEESSSSTYGMFEDNLYQEYAKQAAESGQIGIAQTLFEQMKRNYNLD